MVFMSTLLSILDSSFSLLSSHPPCSPSVHSLGWIVFDTTRYDTRPRRFNDKQNESE